MTMALPVVALAEAEGECCDGLACKDEHTGMAFAGCNMVVNHAPRWPNTTTNIAGAGCGGWHAR